MGQAVIPFLGEASLKEALLKLLEGASPDGHCLVQERAEGVRCEMRAFCCQDLVNGNYAMKLVIMRMKAPEELTVQCFAGHRSIVEAIQVEVRRLDKLWLDWFQERHFPPQVIRLDFLISIPRRDTQSVPFQVHTCELTKCGGSTCGLQVRLCTVAVEDLLKGSRNHFLLLPEERHQSQLDRSKLPERKSGRYGRDQVDSNKTEKETQLESHERRAWPIMAYLVILGANRPIVALYGPCLKKWGMPTRSYTDLWRPASVSGCFDKGFKIDGRGLTARSEPKKIQTCSSHGSRQLSDWPILSLAFHVLECIIYIYTHIIRIYTVHSIMVILYLYSIECSTT